MLHILFHIQPAESIREYHNMSNKFMAGKGFLPGLVASAGICRTRRQRRVAILSRSAPD